MPGICLGPSIINHHIFDYLPMPIPRERWDKKRSILRPAIRRRGLLFQISLIIKLLIFLEKLPISPYLSQLSRHIAELLDKYIIEWYPFTSHLFYHVIIILSPRTTYTSEIVPFAVSEACLILQEIFLSAIFFGKLL